MYSGVDRLLLVCMMRFIVMVWFASMTFSMWHSMRGLKWTLSTRQNKVEFKVATRRLFMPLPVAAL